MTSFYIDPLDLKTILINYLLGTTELFMFALIIVLSIICAYYQMSNRIYFIILIISSIIMAGYLGQSIYVLIIFLIGTVTYKGIGAMMT